MNNQLLVDKNFIVTSDCPLGNVSTIEDYIAEYKINDQTKIGVCEIKGRRASQEDEIAIDRDNVINFPKLARHQQEDLLLSTFTRLQNEYGREEHQGSTVCMVTTWLDELNNVNVVTANLGDSTAFLIINDDENVDATTMRLNKLHKPSDPEEKQRIESLGDNVRYNRINGRISVSRAIGDTEFDSMSHTPDINFEKKHKNDNAKAFVVIACDGLEERLTPEEIYSTVLNNAAKDPAQIASLLVNRGYESGSYDNISVIVIPVSNTCVSAAVFDGHGGNKVSKDLGNHFYATLGSKMALMQNFFKQNSTVNSACTEQSANVNNSLSSNNQSRIPGVGLNRLRNQLFFNPSQQSLNNGTSPTLDESSSPKLK